MVCGVVKLLQSNLLPVPAKENRSPHKATTAVKVGLPAKAQEASLSRTGQTGCTTKTSSGSGLFKPQPLGALGRASGNESVS